jgi:phosphoribosylformylglycinamidine synthase subunit PurL
VQRERALIATLLDAIRAGVVASAHDCSDGGLAVALAECIMANEESILGAEVDLAAWDDIPLRAVLFGEAQGRVVISTGETERVLQIAAANGVPARRIGSVTSLADGLAIRARGKLVKVGTERLAEAYHTAIPRLMETAPLRAAFTDSEK